MNDKKYIKMTRRVLCVVRHEKKLFNDGQVYSADFAGWLPVDSYEYYERKEPVPTPNEIVVEYDG